MTSNIQDMRRMPRRLKEGQMLKLYELTGKSPDDLWPPEIFTREFLVMPKVLKCIREVPVQILAGLGILPALPAGPDEEFDRNVELVEIIEESLKTLTPRREEILRARFLEGLTLEETAQRLAIKNKERVGQIEVRALSCLRSPGLPSSAKRRLRDYARNHDY